MDLRQLEYFVAVAEEANFTRAAARVHVAQSGVSAQIRRLERELGDRLFDRGGRSVKLTAAGAAVLPHARAAIESAASVRESVSDLTGLVTGRLSIGSISFSEAFNLGGLVGDVLAGFHRAHPGVQITLREDTTTDLLAALGSGDIDVAFASRSMVPRSGWSRHPLSEQPLVAVATREHPCARRTSLPIRRLEDVELACLPVGTGVRAELDTACWAVGVTPRIGFEVANPATAVEVASLGLAVAVVPRVVAEGTAGMAVMGLERPSLRVGADLVWQDDRLSRAARAFVTMAREAG